MSEVASYRGNKVGQSVKYAFFEGKIVPMAEAKISIATHGFMYATSIFEGIRAYWNAEQKQMYVLRLTDHLERMFDSMKIMLLEIKYSVELNDIIVDLLKRQEFQTDVYIRITVYKSAQKMVLVCKICLLIFVYLLYLLMIIMKAKKGCMLAFPIVKRIK